MRAILAVVAISLSTLTLMADDCDGRVKRHFTIQTLPAQEVEVGYTWEFKGDLGICGQCGWANAPGGQQTPGNPFTVVMNWGDDSTNALTIGMTPGQPHSTTASHTFDHPSPLGQGFKPVASGNAYCIAGWGQFWEYVASNGAFSSESWVARQYGTDFASTPVINVYAAVRPTGLYIENPLHHGRENKGALTVVIQKGAPASKTLLNIESSDQRVKIRATDTSDLRLPASNVLDYKLQFPMPEGDSSAIFDIITTGAPAGTHVTFTVSNVAPGGGKLTKGPIRLQ